MCGRFVSSLPLADLSAVFGADPHDATELAPDYNVAPTDPVQVVRQREGERVVTTMRWGLVPHWAPDTRDAARRINARSETVIEKPAFRDAFLRRRCIVPAAGFYEWRHKQPFLISPRHGDVLAFAGLWDRRGDLRTCTILTTEANETMRPLHHRMPVVLSPATWDDWLVDDDLVALQSLLVPAEEGLLTTRPVSSAVNSVRNKGVEVLAQPGPDQLELGLA